MKQIVWRGTLKEGSAVNNNIDLFIYLFIYVEYVWCMGRTADILYILMKA